MHIFREVITHYSLEYMITFNLTFVTVYAKKNLQIDPKEF